MTGFARQTAGQGRPASGLRILLMNEEGTVVAETLSAYDGY